MPGYRQELSTGCWNWQSIVTPGGRLKADGASTLAACAHKCNTEPTCKAFNWSPAGGYEGGNCDKETYPWCDEVCYLFERSCNKAPDMQEWDLYSKVS